MKRDKVKVSTVDGAIKPYTAHGKTIYYHNLTMMNGDKINIGKTKELSVGDILSYEIVGDKDANGNYQQQYPKAKAWNPDYEKKGFDSKGVEVGHAINNAVNMICAGVELSCESGNSNEEKIYNYAKTVLAIAKRLKDE